MLAPLESSDTATGAYILVGTARTFRVNSDQTTTPIVHVTATSKTYGVTFSWDMLASVWDDDGGPPLIAERTGQVDEICGHAHVQGFRSEADLDASQLLYNYGVITVGTDDQAITDEARVRMDHLGLPSTFGTIDAVWKRLVKAGAS
jgi:hypothetical protein